MFKYFRYIPYNTRDISTKGFHKASNTFTSLSNLILFSKSSYVSETFF